MDSGDRVSLPPETTLSSVHMLKSVTMLLFIFSNVMVVISTMTKIIVVIATQRQTQQDVLAGQAAKKEYPFLTLN